MNQNIKGVIFFDVDGTLVDSGNHKRQPSEMTLQSIRKAQDNGYLCFIASGRNYRNLGDLLTIGMDGFVYADGGGILLPDGKEQFYPMPKEQVNRLIHEVVDEHDGSVCLATRDTHFMSERHIEYFTEMSKEFGKVNHCPEDTLLKTFGVEPLSAWKDEEILQIDLTFSSSENEQKWIAIKDANVQYVHTADSFGKFSIMSGEATYLGVTKASGCLKVMEYYGLTMQEAIAFGDSMNDIEMLQEVGTGIAMGNADESLKQYANMVTETVTKEGITVGLQKLGIIE